MSSPPVSESDTMRCRACGRVERASEGYPCNDCGTFVCLICMFRGVIYCAACAEEHKRAPRPEPLPGTGPQGRPHH